MKPLDLLSIGATIWCSVFAFISAAQLPERVAVHFDINGNPDRYGNRLEASIIMLIPAIAILLLWVMDKFLPNLDARVRDAQKTMSTIQITITLFMIILQFWIIAAFKNNSIGDSRIFFIAIGALFMVIGNIMPKTPPNKFAGIKFPWTFGSDRAWYATHRVGGWHWVILGATLAILALTLPSSILITVMLIWTAAMFTSLTYLWFYSKKQYQADPERRSI